MKPDPKPIKQEPLKMTSEEFRKKYGSKKSLRKPNRTMSKPKSQRKKLIELADTWFSRRVRLEASDNQGYGKCIDCGAPIFVKDGDCGHFYSRRHYSTRWEIDNCKLQKKRCNINMGRPETNKGYRTNLINQIGEKRFNEITLKKGNTWKPSAFDLELIIKENKLRTYVLLKLKGLKKWW